MKIGYNARTIDLTELRKLDLRGNEIYNILILKNLKQLTLLSDQVDHTEDENHLEEIDNNDLLSNTYSTALTRMLNVKKDGTFALNLIGLELKALPEYIVNLDNLKGLSLRNNQIKDIFLLHNLKQLRYLDLKKNGISDISLLRSLNQLEYLNLKNNPIGNISILKRLKNLKHLSIDEMLYRQFETELNNLAINISTNGIKQRGLKKYKYSVNDNLMNDLIKAAIPISKSTRIYLDNSIALGNQNLPNTLDLQTNKDQKESIKLDLSNLATEHDETTPTKRKRRRKRNNKSLDGKETEAFTKLDSNNNNNPIDLNQEVNSSEIAKLTADDLEYLKAFAKKNPPNPLKLIDLQINDKEPQKLDSTNNNAIDDTLTLNKEVNSSEIPKLTADDLEHLKAFAKKNPPNPLKLIDIRPKRKDLHTNQDVNSSTVPKLTTNDADDLRTFDKQDLPYTQNLIDIRPKTKRFIR